MIRDDGAYDPASYSVAVSGGFVRLIIAAITIQVTFFLISFFIRRIVIARLVALRSSGCFT